MLDVLRLVYSGHVATGVFFLVKMATQDLTSPVAANQLAAGAFFSVKMATQDLTSPVAAIRLAAGAFFLVKMATQGLTSPVLLRKLAAGAFFFGLRRSGAVRLIAWDFQAIRRSVAPLISEGFARKQYCSLG